MIKSDLITLFLLDVSRLIQIFVKFSIYIVSNATLHYISHVISLLSRNVTFSILYDVARPLSHYVITDTKFEWKVKFCNKLRLRGRPC